MDIQLIQKIFGTKQNTKGHAQEAKIVYGRLCLREENISFINI